MKKEIKKHDLISQEEIANLSWVYGVSMESLLNWVNLFDSFSCKEFEQGLAICQEFDIEEEVDIYDVLDNLHRKIDDFTVNEVRFITEEESVNCLVDMYSADPYTLGYFAPSFIYNNTNIKCFEAIEALQRAEFFEELGILILEHSDLEYFMVEAIRMDGPASMLGAYDVNYTDLRILSKDYYVFKV